MISDATMVKTREKTVADLEFVRPALNDIQDGLTKEVFELVEREIDALGNINHLG